MRKLIMRIFQLGIHLMNCRWEGYIKIPITGKYIFTTLSDDGNALYVNDQQILTHNMGAVGPENEGVTWMEAMHKEVNLVFNESLIHRGLTKILLKFRCKEDLNTRLKC